MIDRKFWEDARKVWVVMPPPTIKSVKTGSGGEIDPSLLIDPWNLESSMQSTAQSDGTMGHTNLQESNNQLRELTPAIEKPKLNKEEFDELMEKRNMTDYLRACHLLLCCDLPEKMAKVYEELIEQMKILEEAVVKFKDVYHTDLDQFYEYYIPEALQLTATYLEYIEIGIDDEIVIE